MSDISLTQNRQPALTGLAIEATPVIEYGGPEDFKAQSGDVTVRAGGKGTLLAFKAEATGTAGQGAQATITFTLEAPRSPPSRCLPVRRRCRPDAPRARSAPCSRPRSSRSRRG
ncbi:MAG: hypothetical protein WDM96_11880 [Lacunisphaera sp.]